MVSYTTSYKLLLMSSFASTMPSQSNKSVVYFTPSNMEVQGNNTIDFGVLKITALPFEYNNKEKTIELCEKVLKLGKVDPTRVVVNVSKPRYNARLSKEVATNYALIHIDQSPSTVCCLQMNESFASESSVDVITEEQFHWPNGDVMTHLSIKRLANNFEEMTEYKNVNKTNAIKSTEPLELSDDAWKSLYVSNIPNMLGVECGENTFMRVHPRDLETIIESNLMLGKVSRVDYVKREVESGTFVNDAFVHFQHWYDNDQAKEFRDDLNQGKPSVKVSGYQIGSIRRNLVVFQNNGTKKSAYLNFKINHKPIEEVDDTDLNVHQLVAANKFLNDELESKNAIIEKLEKELETLRQSD